MANIKQKLDKLFVWFEENRFTDSLDHDRQTNLVLEFADWSDSPEGRDFITDCFGDSAQTAIDSINRGVNRFLDQSVNYPFLF